MDHSMERMPPIPPQDLTDDQRPIHDQVTSMLPGGNQSFKYRDDSTGALIGPFPALLRTPDIARAWTAALKSIAQTAKAATPPFPPECREIAILTVGAKFQAGYELYSHEHVSRTETSLTMEQIRELKTGKKPSDLDEKGNVAYDVAKVLIEKPGPLGDGQWNKAVEVLGKEASVALVHYTGFYCYLCVVLNGMDIPVPED